MTPEEALAAMESIRTRRAALLEAIKQTPAVRLRAIVAARAAGWTFDEIGFALGISRERARILWRQAL